MPTPVDLTEQPSGKFVLQIKVDGLEDIAGHLSQLQDTLKFVGTDLRQPIQDLQIAYAQIRPALLESAAIVREYLSSIQFQVPIVDRLGIDRAAAQDGDLEAAYRLSTRIFWNPSPWQRQAIRLRARAQGTSPLQVKQDCLTQGVLLALGWKRDQVLPLLVQSQSAWLYKPDQTLFSVDPGNLPAPLFWRWLWEEAARAAGLWLVGYPYAPTVVLAEPPDEGGEWKLAKFTSEDPQGILKGCPFGSGIFQDRQAFLVEIRLAVALVHSRGNQVTQERVAEALSQRGLVGSSDPKRQLRHWVREFGYANWKDLLNCL